MHTHGVFGGGGGDPTSAERLFSTPASFRYTNTLTFLDTSSMWMRPSTLLVLPRSQELTLVHFSAQRKHCCGMHWVVSVTKAAQAKEWTCVSPRQPSCEALLWDTLEGFTDKTAQVKVRSGRA